MAKASLLNRSSLGTGWRLSRSSVPGSPVCVRTRKGCKMLLCKKIKLEVSEQDAATLEFMQGKCRGLYNWWIGRLRDGEKWNLYDAKATLAESKQHDPELHHVYGKLLAEVYFRADKAMKAFYRRCKERKEGEKLGFPR